MLSYIVVAAALILAILVRLIGGRTLPHAGIGLRTGAVIVVIAGAALAWHSSGRIAGAFQRRDWPDATATIIRSDVTGDRSFAPLIVYQYEVSDTTYTDSTDLNVPMFGGKRKKYEVAEKTSAAYPVGSTVLIHYNPDHPATSYIRSSLRWNVYGQLGLGFTLIVIGAGMLLLPRKRSHD